MANLGGGAPNELSTITPYPKRDLDFSENDHLAYVILDVIPCETKECFCPLFTIC